MKAIDIINRLKQILPRYTSLFSDEISIASLNYDYGFVTCTCSQKHNLSVGDEFFVKGALTPISIGSLTRVGNIATAVTISNHDLTRDYQETVNITGANETAYNGEHTLLDVPNRRTFTFSVSGNPSTPATGALRMYQNIAGGYNGLHVVSNLMDDYTFKYAITSAPESPALGTIVLRKGLAITGDVTMERFLEAYSKQLSSKFYIVVILGGTFASKDRYTLSDATNTSTANAVARRIRIIDPFSIYIVAPTSEYLTAMTVRDGMEDMAQMLNRAVLFYTFPTDSYSQTNLSVSFTSHNMFSYDIAYYIHEFKYEFVYDLVSQDGIDDDDSVAFRDIDLHFNSYLNSSGNELMHTLVDLDDVPLP